MMAVWCQVRGEVGSGGLFCGEEDWEVVHVDMLQGASLRHYPCLQI